MRQHSLIHSKRINIFRIPFSKILQRTHDTEKKGKEKWKVQIYEISMNEKETEIQINILKYLKFFSDFIKKFLKCCVILFCEQFLLFLLERTYNSINLI